LVFFLEACFCSAFTTGLVLGTAWLIGIFFSFLTALALGFYEALGVYFADFLAFSLICKIGSSFSI
jgi:hypothetical protein